MDLNSLGIINNLIEDKIVQNKAIQVFTKDEKNSGIFTLNI